MHSAYGGRAILAGSNRAAVLVLGQLLSVVAAEDVLVIAPPQPVHFWHESLVDAAATSGVEVISPLDVNDPSIVRRIADHECDLFLSVYFHQIFNGELLDSVRGSALNVHPSLLPRHRGVAPLIWAIADGDPVAGVTIHHMTAALDAGPVVWQKPLPIAEMDTGFTLHQKAADLVSEGVGEILGPWAAGSGVPVGRPQEGHASYHRYSDPPLNHIDWAWTATRIRNVVRALAPPLPGAHVLVGQERVVFAEVEVIESAAAGARLPGSLEIDPDGYPVVGAADGAVRVLTFLHQGELVPGTEFRRIHLADGLGSVRVLG